MDQLKKAFYRAPVTVSVIGICVIVYAISFLLYGEEMNVAEGIAFGGYNPLYVYYQHEYYRFITANFIHFGLLHIAVNCYSLYGIGCFIESCLKTKRYIIVLICSALATTGLPYLLFLFTGFGASSVSGGISGVIFGMIGSLGALALCYKDIFAKIFKQLFANVALMLFISLVVPSISMSGHVSGLIGGFVVTYILIRQPIKQKENHLVN